ncbi:acyl carrier protein [Catalinimonas niigatensis]|uniref:acyl carrier protein n=1 Tax=Catalinimonas niigatensis TaxID=1397264 RepID=UPI002665F143|nr:phosphopantetheine-binding protein [Catalinimonas niigatensis]WPP49825.1 phosphopantetheine-binding protein [Catalinimonas niigatensis]
MKEIILRLLKKTAPEADLKQLDSQANLREELDIDSIDWLNLIVAIDEELGIDIPESDYDQLTTLDDMIHYLSRMKHE